MGKLFKIEQEVVKIHRFEIGGNRKNLRKIQTGVRENSTFQEKKNTKIIIKKRDCIVTSLVFGVV